MKPMCLCIYCLDYKMPDDVYCVPYRAKHARREERYRKKTQYEQGMWNIDTVMMGGLGGDPHSSGTSSEEGT